MELLKMMATKNLPSWGIGDFKKTELETYEKAKQEFIEMLGEPKMRFEFVAQVFEVMDCLFQQYTENNPIACKLGCSACCLQSVSCTGVEMELIRNYILSLPRAQCREVFKRLKKEAVKFHRYYKRELGNFSKNVVKRWEDIAEPLKEKHLGIPCVYLSKKGACLIYEARPWNCRITWTKTSCRERQNEVILPDKFISESEKGQAIYLLQNEEKLIFEEVAIELIEREQIRVYGSFEMVLLEAWPITETFSKFFF